MLSFLPDPRPRGGTLLSGFFRDHSLFYHTLFPFRPSIAKAYGIKYKMARNYERYSIYPSHTVSLILFN